MPLPQSGPTILHTTEYCTEELHCAINLTGIKCELCECVSREGGWALTESGDAIVGELELHQGHSCVQAMDGGQLVPAQPQHLEPGQVPTVHVRDRIFLDSTQD